MALSTKAELRTSLKNWTKRTDLTDAELDDFIRLTEIELNRVLRVPAQEQRNAAFTISSEYTTLPDDFRELRSAFITNNGGHNLKLISPQAANDAFDYNATGVPLNYEITGDAGVLSMRVVPSPSGSFNCDLLYYAGFDEITDSATNWLFDNHPDCYLWGGLLQMMPYIGDDERSPMWQDKYANAVKAIIDEGNRTRWRGSQPAQRVRVTP